MQIKWIFYVSFALAFSLGQVLHADETLDKLFSEYDEISRTHARCTVLVPEFREGLPSQKSLMDDWKECANAIRQLGANRADKLIEARGLIRCAYVLSHANDRDSKKTIPDLIKQAYESIGDEKKTTAFGEVLMYHGHTILMTGTRGDSLESAQKKLEQAMLLAADHQDDKLLTRSCNFLAETFLRQGKSQLARNTAIRGLNVAESVAESTGDDSLMKIALPPLIVLRRLEIGIDGAVPYAKRQLEISPDSHVAEKVLAMKYGDDELAKKYNKAIERIERESKNKPPMVLAHLKYELAMIYRASGDYEKASELLKHAESIYRSLGYKNRATFCALYLAKFNIKLGKPVDKFDELESYVNKIPSPPKFRKYSRDLAEIFSKSGNFEKAAVWYKKSIEMNEKQLEQDFHSLVSSGQEFLNTELRYRDAVKAQTKREMTSRFYLLAFGSAIALLLSCILFGMWRYKILRSTKSNLEELVKQRTTSLKTAIEKAELATQAKSDFLANVNHEIRNPLAAIVACGEILELESDSDEINRKNFRRSVESLNSSTKLLLNIVEDVLDIVKIEQGHVTIKTEHEQLGEVCCDINTLLEDVARKKKIAFSIQCDYPDAIVSTDITRVKQIVLNIAENAIKNTKTGFVRANLSVGHPESKVLSIVVEDSGSGISTEMQKKIFDPFYQADEKVGGVGLGLWIVIRLVEALQGTIDLESELSVGTKISISIPLNTQVVSSQIVETDKSIDGCKILVVDDKPFVRDAICGQLKMMGCLVSAAETIEDSMRMIETESPDFVFLDLRMPDHDGFAYLETIRKRFFDAPHCIAVTGDATAEIREKCTAAGFDGFLAKPIRSRNVRLVLSQIQNSIPSKG